MTVDQSVPRANSELRTQMLVLARLSERVGRFEPRGILLDRILRQMRLFSRMAERLGIAAPQSELTRAVAREAELGCLECATWRRCRQWLDGHSPDDDHRDFCPSEGLLAVLPHQDKVQQDLGGQDT
jgi:hypothetical protein